MAKDKKEDKERPVDKVPLGEGLLDKAAKFLKGRRGAIDDAVEKATRPSQSKKWTN